MPWPTHYPKVLPRKPQRKSLMALVKPRTLPVEWAKHSEHSVVAIAAEVVMLAALQMLEEEEVECQVVATAEAERCLEEEAVLVAMVLLQEEVWTADLLAAAVRQAEKQEDQLEVVPLLSLRCRMEVRQVRHLVAEEAVACPVHPSRLP